MAEPAIDDLLAAELRHHPLGAEIMARAQASGVALTDLAAMARLVAALGNPAAPGPQAGGRAAPDPAEAAPLILTLATLLQDVARHTARKPAGAPPDDTCADMDSGMNSGTDFGRNLGSDAFGADGAGAATSDAVAPTATAPHPDTPAPGRTAPDEGDAAWPYPA
ncbi:hypothetical protein EKE94_16140 [Mesobaculum littorinae]|uniref:Uncharacterized protein n=1 Tax=Mesobaculum littorinae TaxID=2486419 RepID=A0A438ADV6_9RHOB|nr:hypothetical protein [Mesobaculum littorinae]RVV96874.1 hypothetical protein EKE94_16140 [Mesobaculum littorinae]